MKILETVDRICAIYGVGHRATCMCTACALRHQAAYADLMTACTRPTDEQRSLAWCPEPPYESTGPHDCRAGGSAGIGYHGTRHEDWVRARYRVRQEASNG